MIRGHRKAPHSMKRAADLDWVAPGGIRSHPATRLSPNFKTGVPGESWQAGSIPVPSAVYIHDPQNDVHLATQPQ
jgi:hypothetical protein